MFDLFWDGVWFVLTHNARIGRRALQAHDRYTDRRAARRYAKGPGRIPTKAEMARMREQTEDIPRTRLDRSA